MSRSSRSNAGSGQTWITCEQSWVYDAVHEVILVNEPDRVNEGPEQAGEEKEPGLTPLQVVGSVFSAALGVQSSENRERDFRKGRFGIFIAAGIIFTALFVGTVYLVVSVVISNAR